VNLTDNILSFMTKVNVDFVIKGMKCHKDDEHNVRGLDTEVNKHFVFPHFVFPHGNFLLATFTPASCVHILTYILHSVTDRGSTIRL
jgi:hypothetical protein